MMHAESLDSQPPFQLHLATSRIDVIVCTQRLSDLQQASTIT